MDRKELKRLATDTEGFERFAESVAEICQAFNYPSKLLGLNLSNMTNEINYHTTVQYCKNSVRPGPAIVMFDFDMGISKGDLYVHRTGRTDFDPKAESDLKEGEYRVFEKIYIVRPTYSGVRNISIIICITDDK